MYNKYIYIIYIYSETLIVKTRRREEQRTKSRKKYQMKYENGKIIAIYKIVVTKLPIYKIKQKRAKQLKLN